jgi:putative transcriptional regulator
LNEPIIKNRVKISRIEKSNLTQEELANLVGVTRQTISLIESGKYNPTIKLCLMIAKVLNKRVDELFWMEEDGDV